MTACTQTLVACADELLGQPARQVPMFGVGETGGAEHGDHVGRLGEVRHAARQVAIGRTVREQRTDLRYHLAEVDVVAETQHLALRHAHIDQRDSPTGSGDPGDVGEEGGQIEQVAQCKATRDTVNHAIRNGQTQNVGLHPRSTGAVGCEHAVTEVDRDRSQPGRAKVHTEVAGARRQVDHGGTSR